MINLQKHISYNGGVSQGSVNFVAIAFDFPVLSHGIGIAFC